MKRFLIFGGSFIFLVFGCSPKMTRDIVYEVNYDNKSKIENEIRKMGVTINFAEGHNEGKGVFYILDTKDGVKEEYSTFSMVEKEYSYDGIVAVSNGIPTNEGVYKMSLNFENGNPKVTFKIIEDYQNSIEFETVTSKVKMNKPLNSDGIVAIKIEYQGKQKEGNRILKIKNEFFLNNN